MRVTMIGTGYVGLVSGACLAELGHEVTCMDADAGKIAGLRAGRMPIFEPGLEALVARNLGAGRLGFTTSLPEALRNCPVVFICVGTPPRPEDGEADLSQVQAAARAVARAMSGFCVVVTKSTVPVGTAESLEQIIRAERPEAAFQVASNPEFLREGEAISDFMSPDRIVLGAQEERALARLRELYAPLEAAGARVVTTGRRGAELIKYAANAYLAMRISYVNELADLCEAANADIADVALGLGLDNRIGQRFLQPGPGFGGSCFPKDTLALARTARNLGAPLTLVEAAIGANDARKRGLAARVVAAAGGDLRGRTVGLLGLAFKAGTDDLRDAASLSLAPALKAAGASVKAFDPAANATHPALAGVRLAEDPYACARAADALVILTEWPQFRSLDLARLRGLMRQPLIIDFRNLLDPAAVRAEGFRYVALGRPARGQAASLDGRTAAPVLPRSSTGRRVHAGAGPG